MDETITASFLPQPDLHPLYPTPELLTSLLSSSTSLSPEQKKILISHSLQRACSFGDLSLLTFLLHDDQCRKWIDLEEHDEDDVGLVGTCIMGFRAREVLEGDESGHAFDREMEREECIRLLIKEGADLTAVDHAGWTALHHAALLAPPSLISHLLSHGSSPLAQSRRKLTPLDVVTAYEDVPGREDVIIMLREAMFSIGWKGDEKKEEERRMKERRLWKRDRRRRIKEELCTVLREELAGMSHTNWGDGTDEEVDEFEPSDLDDEDSDGYDSDTLQTPPESYRTMLVFSPPALGRIFQALIPLPLPNSRNRAFRNPVPAQALYSLSRFACIACDHNWLEDLIVGAMDRVEEVVMADPNDLSSLAHWLFNTTLLLHLLRCDQTTSQICEILGLFGLMEELVNVVYVLVIRIIERRLDPLIDMALLEHTPPELVSEFEDLQFEGEWEWSNLLGRVISPKKKPTTPAKGAGSTGKMGIPKSTSTGSVNSKHKTSNSLGSKGGMATPGSNAQSGTGRSANAGSKSATRPSSPTSGLLSASNSGTFSSIKSTLQRATGAAGPGSTPQSSVIFNPSDSNATLTSTPNGPSPSASKGALNGKAGDAGGKGSGPSPQDVTALLTAIHTFLTLSGVNPILIVQTFSQVMYWTSCEIFNRMLQRKKFLCRSRALQIGLNLGVLEEWVSGGVSVGLPREVGGHFRVVRELVSWLQCLSSIDQFTSLIATVQTFKNINPLQMRRAVRDYRYEVGESRMTEECAQYLAQLQKDWERERVKLGVEALQKERNEREGSGSSHSGPANGSTSPPQQQSMSTSSSAEVQAQRAMDDLFSRTFDKSEWHPAKPPPVLGELLDSRHMLPILFPSDPVHLGALPVLRKERHKRESGMRFGPGPSLGMISASVSGHSRSSSYAGSQAGSRSASRASIGNRGAMEWLSRPRKLRVLDRSMLKQLGDDEVASEVEAIAAKWKHIWNSSLAASTTEGTVGDDSMHSVPGLQDVAVVMQDGDVNGSGDSERYYGSEIDGESLRVMSPTPKLTLEPPRLAKETRRRASQMNDDDEED